MINLPLNITQSFQTAPQNVVVNNLTLFDRLLENEKFVAMQFTFDVNVSWKIDITLGSPIKPLSKITNLYIDAINSTHDVLVYIPDTGYMIHVAAGTTFLSPTLISRGAYVFYVSLDQQITDPNDIVNIFALNVSIPFFDSLWQYPQGKPTNSPSGSNKSRWFFVGSHFPNGYSIVSLPRATADPVRYPISFMNSFSIAYEFFCTSGSGIITYGLWYIDNDLDDYSRPIKTYTIAFNATSDRQLLHVNQNETNINWTNPGVSNGGRVWSTSLITSGIGGFDPIYHGIRFLGSAYFN